MAAPNADKSTGASGLNVTPKTGFMPALPGDGCCEKPIVARGRAGTNFDDDVRLVHGSHRLFFA